MSNASYISPEAMALMQEDSRLWEKARVKEDPFNIKAPDGDYISILAKVVVKVLTKEGTKYVQWTFLWILVCDSSTGKNGNAGAQVIIRHDIIASEKVSKEQKYEYLNFDLKALGIANAKELTVADFPDVVRGLNTQRKAGIISIKTANGYKNGRLKETVKLEQIKPYLTPETEALLAEAIAADDVELEQASSGSTAGDALDDMDRAQLLDVNKEQKLDLKTKGKSDDEVRNMVREALKAKAAASEEEEEEEEEAAAPQVAPFESDPLAGLSRTELLDLKKKYNLSFQTKGETDDVVRERLREALKNVEAAPDESGEE